MNPARTVTAAVLALVLTTSLLAASGGVLAQGDEPDWSGDLYDRMGPMVERYNEHADDLDLGFAGQQLQDRVINVYVSGPGGTATYSFYMDGDLHISELSDDTRDDASLKLTTDRATIESIAESDNPAAAFRDAVERGDIVIDGEDDQIIQRIKWSVLNFLRGFLL